MTRYTVVFGVLAQEEALEAAEYIGRTSPMNAVRWFAGLEEAINSLGHLPQRCGRAPETETLGQELRHYLYKSHRIIFRIEETNRIVRVLHVRHGARRAIGEMVDENDADQ